MMLQIIDNEYWKATRVYLIICIRKYLGENEDSDKKIW